MTDRLKIRLYNLLIYAGLFKHDVRFKLLIISYLILFAAFLLICLTGFGDSAIKNVEGIKKQDIIKERRVQTDDSLSPGCFYTEGESVPPDTPGSGRAGTDLILTGIGRVKGDYKVSIEDTAGNCFYLKKGDRFSRYSVKEIMENEVEILDNKGNIFILKLRK